MVHKDKNKHSKSLKRLEKNLKKKGVDIEKILFKKFENLRQDINKELKEIYNE